MSAPEIEAVSWGRFALASVTVAGLLSFMAFGFKYLLARGFVLPHGKTTSRLKFVAALPLDARRRLVLARCDEKEYLLLLGGNNDLVLSSFPPPPAPDSKP